MGTAGRCTATLVLKGITFTDFQRRLEEALRGADQQAAAEAAISDYVEPLITQAEASNYTARAAGLLESHFQEIREAVRSASFQLAEPEASPLLASIDRAVARCAAVPQIRPTS